MKTITRRTLLTIAAAAVVVIVWLLIESRPPLPTTTGITITDNLIRLLGCLAWLGTLLLTLGLFSRLVSRRSLRLLARPLPTRQVQRRQRTTHPHAAGGYASRAFPLILQPRAIGDACTEPPNTAEDSRELQLPFAPEHESSREVSAASIPTLCISVLGQPVIEGGRRYGRKLRGSTRDLLAYLALRPNGAHRDQLTDELWPDQPPDRARNRLWRAMADARSHFGDAIIIRNSDHYRLNRTAARVDLDELREQQAALANSPSSDEELACLEAALALFRGEPFEGSDLPWAENEQRRLHALRLEFLERAGRNRLSRGDASGALADAEAGLAQEPYNESLARVAMQAEAALGLRTALISRYEKLRELLERELGLQPHRETRFLFRTLLGQEPRH